MDVTGGRAHFHGVSFSGKNTNVKAYRNDIGEIRTEMSRKFWREIPWIDRLYAVPFLRGAMLYIDIFLTLWKPLLILLGAFFVVLEGLSFLMPDEAYGQTVNGLTVFLKISKVLIFVWFFLLFKRSRMASYHGAEHKTFHAYEKNIELTVENVRKEDRVSVSCGTNFVVFFGFTYAVLSFLPIDSWLRLILSWAVGYELFILPWHDQNHWLHYALYPFFMIGLAMQRYVVTSEPDDEEIETAIAALSALRTLS
ncbi:uncharacterized protein YqhQ [Scopulibacillus darangshiensis]|uniref:Uncharacterized protein YqhQ n=1 Tax=Scopulibacillus darangshiensis TaxID=442528 RepID=A0A4V2SMX4_9BACL|nr:DUF1385 domain-containing protein [Scopulibacillus darangshiensis]TCP28986.1 uncharacterized protein YqhQ [Scopulibacillus darangshiensis]